MKNSEIKSKLSKLLSRNYSIDLNFSRNYFYIHRKNQSIPVACIDMNDNKDLLFIKCLEFIKSKIRVTSEKLDMMVTYYEMGISCLAYHTYNSGHELKADIENHIHSYSKLFSYDLAVELCEIMLNSVDTVYRNVSTDNEGCSYNSISFC